MEGERLYQPYGVAVDNQGRIFVVDRGKARVVVFNEKGQVLFTFGSLGDGRGQFNCPSAVRPVPIVLVKCWKVAHWNAKKLLKNCQKSKKLLPKFQKLLPKFLAQIWAKFKDTLKSNGTKHMVHLTSGRTI